MIIYKEDIEGSYDLSIEDELDFSRVKIEDKLVDKVNSCDFELKVNLLNEEDFIFNLHIITNIDYLDAKTLQSLTLHLDFNEEVPFSFNKDTANELDIDFFDEELNLKELIFELILINIPLNYSENTNVMVISEEEFLNDNQNTPFAQIFNNKKEEE